MDKCCKKDGDEEKSCACEHTEEKSCDGACAEGGCGCEGDKEDNKQE